MKKILAPVFTDHMVLQRDKAITLFGCTEASVTVELSLSDQVVTAQSDAHGNWEAIFPPMPAATNLTLTVKSGSDLVTLTDIALGEVWLAGGQSNMEFELSRCTDWDRVKHNPNPEIRFFYTPKMPYSHEPTEDYAKAFEDAHWETTDSEGFVNWSAAGYLFAEKIQAELGVTVGIIGCNWGGTSASAWMSREALLEDSDTRLYVDDYDQAVSGIPVEEQIKAYDSYFAYHTEWDKKCGALYVENPSITWSEVESILGPCQWPGPMNCKNPFRPSGLYETMIQAVCPYTLRGFIYYQGESDDHRPRTYYKLLSRMIRNWREDWKDTSLPFILVQLPMHRYDGDSDYKNWPVIREAQMEIFRQVRNTGLAVVIEHGQKNDIHPLNKGPVGYRLALSALCEVYGRISEEEAYGPFYSHKIPHGSTLLIHFSNTGEGLLAKGTPALFEIAGADKIFQTADVRLGKDHVELSSCGVARPVYARYCWTNYGEPTIFGSNGLPVAPFRTDRNDETDLSLGSASIQQNPEV